MQIRVSLGRQMLDLLDNARVCIRRYAISTASKGAGETKGSYQTPRGEHVIRAMIGRGAPCGAVFKARRPTGEVWSPALHESAPGRDWILSRILWLSGAELGRNRLGSVDTMQRYIYIHGTPDSEPMGVAKSHGCIRMRNTEVIELFELVSPGTRVEIVE